MDLLCHGMIHMNNNKNNIKPSPALKKSAPGLARDPESPENYLCGPASKGHGMKGLSLPVLLFARVRAGMTVEAALVLPLLCFFMINLSSAIEMIRLHNNMQMALWDTGSRLAVYGYGVEGREAAASLFSVFYIKSRIQDYLGENYLEQSPMRGGIGGLRLWESGMYMESDELDITATYQISSWYPLAAFSPFRLANRFCVHIWNGYRISQDFKESAFVYVTEHGEVYHTSRDCTHLTLTVRQTSCTGLEDLRNQSGRRYTACGKCSTGESGGNVFITEEGNHYHFSLSCSGLKRIVYMILEEQAAGYRMCSRCGGG